MYSRREEVDTLILNDLHLGSPYHDTSTLLAVRLFRFRRVIIPGDFIDVSNPELSREQQELVERLREAEEIHITTGNHDDDKTLRHLLPNSHLHESYEWQHGGRRFIALHGHRQDLFWSQKTSKRALAGWALRHLERWGSFGEWLITRGKKNLGDYERMVAQIEEGVASYARDRACDIAIGGHTHKVVSRIIQGVLYVNLGCWLKKNRPSYLATICKHDVRRHGFKQGRRVSLRTLAA